jgi:cell division protein FtsN
MNYEFALDKKALISLIAGSVVIGVLLFLGGLIVGRQWTVVVSAEAASRSTDEERVALPKEPVLHEEDASAPNTAMPGSNKPKVTAPQEPTAAAAATQASAAATQPPASQPAGDVRIIESVTDNAAGQPGEVASEPEYVTVQVGVFLDQKEASHLLQQIESRGYAPTFFSGRDAEARQWYAVRIGVYSDKQQATNAAANFTKQEKLKAVVRPLETL